MTVSGEKRKFGRRTVLWHAWVVVSGRPREACIIRNMSAAGALLEFSSAPPEADSFRLVVDEGHFSAACDVRHRRGRFVGVFFAQNAVVATSDKGPTGTQIAFQLRESISGVG